MKQEKRTIERVAEFEQFIGREYEIREIYPEIYDYQKRYLEDMADNKKRGRK